MDRVLVNDALDAFDLDSALREVSPERRAYALGYRFERDRRLSVAVYLLLKEALRSGYGIVGNPRIARGATGKPFLPDYPYIHFNFSHCPKAAACIVSDRPVGIDVEEIAPIDWAVARRVLSDAELAKVRASAAPEMVFARYWTRKEAVVKMTGEGMDDVRMPDLLACTHDCQLLTKVSSTHGYVLTTAAQRPSKTFSCQVTGKRLWGAKLRSGNAPKRSGGQVAAGDREAMRKHPRGSHNHRS